MIFENEDIAYLEEWSFFPHVNWKGHDIFIEKTHSSKSNSLQRPFLMLAIFYKWKSWGTMCIEIAYLEFHVIKYHPFCIELTKPGLSL